MQNWNCTSRFSPNLTTTVYWDFSSIIKWWLQLLNETVVIWLNFRNSYQCLVIKRFWFNFAWIKVRPLSHILTKWIFQTNLLKLVTKCQNGTFVNWFKIKSSLQYSVSKQFWLNSAWRKVRSLSHVLKEWIFRTILLKAVAMLQNKVPVGKWHFCAFVQLWKQLLVLNH